MTMQPLSLKISSDHFLLCVFLTLLWFVTDSNQTAPTSVANPKAPEMTTKPPPPNAAGFQSVEQTETSITLQWEKVDDFLNYTLVLNGKETNVSAPAEHQVRRTISDLTNTTEYDFTLFTVFGNVRSSGVNLIAFTAPPNADKIQSVEQTETSITLQWEKVDDFLNYTLVLNGEETNVSAPAEHQVRRTISDLTNTTKYDFTLFTVFGNVRSSGVNFTAFTAPPNAEKIQSVEQTETSITLQWEKVDDFLNYTLVLNGKETNVSAPAEHQVRRTISDLTNTTKYDFTLFTVFGNVRSSGVNFTAFTAPPNAAGFQSVEQTETSITLQWEKVDNFLNYILVLNGKETNVSAPAEHQVRSTISDLTNTTKYDFTLFTVFGNVRSSGVNLTAFTAPPIANKFKQFTETETSITLQWEKVDDILNYTLVLNGEETNVSAPAGHKVRSTISDLTNTTEYDFTLFTVFGNVRSSGVNLIAFTAPPNAADFQSVAQNETTITLQWEKVNDFLNYTLIHNREEITVPASAGQEPVSHTISELTSGTMYNFSLFTVFGKVRSSGVNYKAPTAPRNVNNVTVTQNESSITLMWDNVNNISSYALQYDNKDINIYHQDASVTYEVVSLNAGTKYDFTLITRFENVNSTGFSFTAVTVPSMVAVVNVTERSVTSLTLTWQTNKDWDYSLQINGEHSQVLPNRAMDVVSQTITSLQPGTAYPFSVITVFSGLNSTAYKGFTVTKIDCSNVPWRVTNSSIQGTIEGLFSNATATNTSQTHVSPGIGHVSFAGLYPGATYEVSLVYEANSMHFLQCRHNLTIIPPYLSAHCEYSDSGYSVFIVWNKPAGVWTSVEMNVTGRNYTVKGNEEQHLKIPGFQPAKTYEVSLASLSGTVRSYEPFVFSCLTDPRGVIAGSVFAVLLFGLLVCLACFISFKRPDIISRNKPFIGGSRQSPKKFKAISVAKFPDHFYQLGVDESRGFSQEYESFIPVGTDQTRDAALLAQNKARNRFNNVLPYDWCRVKLSTSNPNETSDYINASYMPGFKSNREYIATQGPLPSTVNDFWRMIWEQRVKGIVMVTNCTEGGRTKCERYWPADRKPCSYEALVVTIRSERQEPNWTLREFRVKHRNNSEERTVRHFHFTAWPDHGVPQGTEVLIQFRRLVRQHIESNGAEAPTVVHCSAGVGRTGTIIALDVLLQQLEKEKAVGIQGFVHKMRLSRPHMVQTESQYVFLHQCIMNCLQPDEKNEENIYENADMIYVNATALQVLTKA